MNMKYKIFLGVFAVLLIITIVVAAAGLNNVNDTEKSPLYTLVSAYDPWANTWEKPEGISFNASSGEGLLIQGIEAYIDGDYDRSRKLLMEAREKTGSDPAFEAYVWYFRNWCEYTDQGRGNYEAVKNAMEAAKHYTPLANDTAFLWDLLNSISLSEESDMKAIELMEEYIKNSWNLDVTTWAWTKNYIAMLEYNNERYAKSIRHFYDVELALADAEMTPKLEIEQRYAKEYIANIHFIFEDYEKAAELYQELIDNTMSDEQFHAYGCCINMANVYLELGTAEKAREAMYTLADNLSRIDADVVSEVEASMDDVLANIAIAEGNLPEAKEYLEKAEAYYKKNSNNAAFLGGAYYTLLTRCKYMVAEGNLKEVQLILEKNIEEGDAAYYGLEKEFYSLLEKVYQQTGQNEKLAQTYKKLLEMNKEFRITTQREYLEFSGYYKENNQLKDYNVQLNRTKTIAVFSSIIITAVLILLLIFVRLLRRKNVTDQLTGIYNRKKLNQLARTYKRTGTPEKFGVVMMDIDYFKRYNDAYGHPEGDEVLKKVSRVLVGCVRSKDFVIRYGGEEFLVLLNGLTQQNAEDVCRRIHNKLNETAIPHGFSDAADHVTLSMGLCYQEKAKSNSIENLIDLADQCLYSSKKNGRNRVTSQRCD